MQKSLYCNAKEALLHANIGCFGNDCCPANICLLDNQPAESPKRIFIGQQ